MNSRRSRLRDGTRASCIQWRMFPLRVSSNGQCSARAVPLDWPILRPTNPLTVKPWCIPSSIRRVCWLDVLDLLLADKACGSQCCCFRGGSIAACFLCRASQYALRPGSSGSERDPASQAVRDVVSWFGPNGLCEYAPPVQMGSRANDPYHGGDVVRKALGRNLRGVFRLSARTSI